MGDLVWNLFMGRERGYSQNVGVLIVLVLCLKMSLAQKFDRRRGSTVVLQSLLSNFKLIPKAKLPISRLRHFTRRYDLSRYEISPYILPCLSLIILNIYCTTSTVFMIRVIGGYKSEHIVGLGDIYGWSLLYSVQWFGQKFLAMVTTRPCSLLMHP